MANLANQGGQAALNGSAGKSAGSQNADAVVITLYLPVPPKEIQQVLEKGDKGEAIKRLVSTITSILELPATSVSVTKMEAVGGSVAVDLSVSGPDVWQKLGFLQDQIYDPTSRLATAMIDYKPYRAFVSAARPGYNSIQAIHKEQAHFKLAAVAAKQHFFNIAKEDIKARETADEAFTLAQKAESKLRDITDVFSDVVINCTTADQTQKAHYILEEAQVAAKQASEMVSIAAKRATDLFMMAEQAKLAAYFCAVRTGVKESFQDWSRREVIVGILPAGGTISTPQSQFTKARDQALEAEMRAERANSRLNALTKALQELDPSSTSEIQALSAQVQRAQEEFELATAEATKAAEKAARLFQESQNQPQRGAAITQDPTQLFQDTMKAAAAPRFQPNISSLQAPEPLYKCSLGSGFIGTYAQVAEHERRLLESMRVN